MVEVDGDLVGTCHATCTGTWDKLECPAENSCSISGSGSTFLCIPTCDPTIQDCSPGEACFFSGQNFYCLGATQEIPAGEPCGFVNDCAGGLACLDAEAFPACEDSACCSPFCEFGLGDGPCDAVPGTSCVPFFEEGEALEGYEHVGVCVVP